MRPRLLVYLHELGGRAQGYQDDTMYTVIAHAPVESAAAVQRTPVLLIYPSSSTGGSGFSRLRPHLSTGSQRVD